MGLGLGNAIVSMISAVYVHLNKRGGRNPDWLYIYLLSYLLRIDCLDKGWMSVMIKKRKTVDGDGDDGLTRPLAFPVNSTFTRLKSQHHVGKSHVTSMVYVTCVSWPSRHASVR